MAEITAANVGKLREMTGAGMMDCKKALTEAGGELGKAVDILRKKGAATATVKAARDAKDGAIAQYIAPGGKLGVLVEVNSETDFVARNEIFRAFCDDVAKRFATVANPDFEAERQATGRQNPREHQNRPPRENGSDRQRHDRRPTSTPARKSACSSKSARARPRPW